MGNIAVIDINSTSRDAIIALLANLYEVTGFSSVADYIERDPSLVFHLIVTDDAVFGQTQSKPIFEKDIPVVMLIDQQNLVTIDTLKEHGATDYVRKPIHDGILLHRVKLLLDLSTQKQRAEDAQNQLYQSEKLAALGQLAAGVAHEINNPVGFVTSNTNLIDKYLNKMTAALGELEANCSNEETGAALLEYTRWKASTKLFSFMSDLKDISVESLDGLNRIREIVKDLKDYAHVGEMKFEVADINRLLTSSINLLRNEIKYKADVETNFAELPPVHCITSQLGQVFVNIIVNACHAIEEFGKITITTELINDRVQVSFQDTGKGIPKDIIKKVFDPFFTTKPIGKGTGIGLAITRSIIDRHHGDIKVTSVEGEGNLFRVSLPIEQPDFEEGDMPQTDSVNSTAQ